MKKEEYIKQLEKINKELTKALKSTKRTPQAKHVIG